MQDVFCGVPGDIAETIIPSVSVYLWRAELHRAYLAGGKASKAQRTTCKKDNKAALNPNAAKEGRARKAPTREHRMREVWCRSR